MDLLFFCAWPDINVALNYVMEANTESVKILQLLHHQSKQLDCQLDILNVHKYCHSFKVKYAFGISGLK